MRPRSTSFVVVLLPILFLGHGVLAETVDSVETKTIEATKKVKSYTARMKSVTEMEGQGFKNRTVSEGTYEYLTKGDAIMYRSEMSTTSTMEIGGRPTKTESKTLSLSDGRYIHTLSELAGMKTATRMKIERGPDVHGFGLLKKDFVVGVLPEATIDGRKTYVLEAKPKPGSAQAAAVSKMVYHYDQATGIALKIVSFDAAGKPMMTTTYSDLKVDPSLSPDRFVFKAPAGVQVQELGNGG